MSDFSQGEGWWQASDGKWYPPEQATAATPVPPVPPTQPVPPFGSPPPVPMGAPAGGAPAGPPPGGPGAPAKKGLGTGPIIGIVVAALVVLGAIVFFATKDDDDDKKNVAASSSSSTRSSSSSSSTRSSSSTSSSSSSSDGAPDIDAPAGFQVFSNDDDRFAVAIPSSMEVIDLTAADVETIIQSLSETNPAFADLGPQIRSALAAGGKLFALDQASSGSGFTDNINLITTPGFGDVTDPSIQSGIESQLTSIGATNVTFDTVEANGRDILTASYEVTVNGADGTPRTVFGRQAYISADGLLWVFTLSTSAPDTRVFDVLVDTFDVNE